MTEPHRPRVKYVIGPDGSPLTIADLPPPSTKRWVIRRKAEVVAAVRGGLLSLEEACSRYTLDRRRIPVLADVDRPARPRRPAHDAPAAISHVALRGAGEAGDVSAQTPARRGRRLLFSARALALGLGLGFRLGFALGLDLFLGEMVVVLDRLGEPAAFEAQHDENRAAPSGISR